MRLKQALKAPPEQPYIKNSSMLVTALFIIAGVLYYPTNGYGAVIALALAIIVLFGQKMLIAQTRTFFAEMYAAKQQFEQTQNPDYLEFIHLRGTQMLNDNKVLSDKAKAEIQTLLAFVTENRSTVEKQAV